MSVGAWKKLILVANLLLGAGLASAAGVAYLEAIRQEVPRRESASAPRAAKGALPERIQPRQYFEDIWRMRATPDDNVKRVEKAPEPPPPDEERIRQILRQLFKLVGIIFNLSKPADSYAIFTVLSGRQESTTLEVGDTVSGAKLDAIGRDRVWFVYQGIKADVEIEEESPGYGGPMPHAAAARHAGLQPKNAAFEPANAPPPSQIQTEQVFRGSRKIAENHWQIEQNEARYVQDNQQQILNETQPAPYMDREGKQIGVELKQVAQGSYLAQRGMEQGDVVQSINGVPINSMDIQSIAARLKGARTITAVVLRRGQPKTITYNLR